MNEALIQRDKIKLDIEQLKTIETGVEYLNKVKAIEVWVKAEKKDAQIQNQVAEQKIRTQRRIGELIQEGQRKGEIAEKGESKYNSLITNNDKKTLPEMGITLNESSAWQKIASLPEEIFEQELTVNKKNELTTSSILHAAKDYEKTKVREEAAEAGKAKPLNVDLRLGDFETVLNDIPNGSIDCIITDPPYPYEFIECWSKLSRFAQKKLKPYGFCIAYSGQMFLQEVLSRMSEHLNYYWICCLYHVGATTIVHKSNAINAWKPILIFQNGFKKIDYTFSDYVVSEQREKHLHEWQQSESGVNTIIERFTNKSDLICDPFAGGGTTIKAAIKKGRQIIAAEINEQTFNIAKNNLYDDTF